MADAMLLPAVLIDENLPASFAEFFMNRGYTVFVVGADLPAGSPDTSVLAAALAERAVVITADSDFRYMKESAAAEGSRQGLERADRIFFKRCSHVEALHRITELIDTIETEYRIAKASDRRFVIHIARNSFTVFR
jgi:hypothetical protein